MVFICTAAHTRPTLPLTTMRPWWCCRIVPSKPGPSNVDSPNLLSWAGYGIASIVFMAVEFAGLARARICNSLAAGQTEKDIRRGFWLLHNTTVMTVHCQSCFRYTCTLALLWHLTAILFSVVFKSLHLLGPWTQQLTLPAC